MTEEFAPGWFTALEEAGWWCSGGGGHVAALIGQWRQ
jgi:hypothetical protein